MQFSTQVAVLAAVGAAAVTAGAYVIVSRLKRRGDPEAHRRALVAAKGRIIEGNVLDVRDGVVHYSWSWRGVDYECSQDVRALDDQFPSDDLAPGPVSVKFLANMPSNSIVISEDWSGFSRVRPAGRGTTEVPADRHLKGAEG